MFRCRKLIVRILLGVGLTAAGSVGCERRAGETLLPVTGRITFDGQPLTGGSLSLRPDGGNTNWQQPTGMIDANGRFVVYTNSQAGAPPGTYRIVAFVTETTKTETGAARPGLPRSLIPPRYNDPQQTPLRLTVVAQPTADAYNLELTSSDK